MTTTETTIKNPPTEAAKSRRQRHKMKQRCAILSIQPISPTTCRVWGGEGEHIVSFIDGVVTCDCLGYTTARNHNCSHVMKYRLTYGDLKK